MASRYSGESTMPIMNLVISIRTICFVAASIGVVAGVTATEWATLTRETRFDGFVQQEHLILGRFRRTTDSVAPQLNVTQPVALKMSEYGLPGIEESGRSTITLEGKRAKFSYSIDKSVDLRSEASRLGRSCPWLTVTWRGTRFTSFVAQGFHPTKKGHVSVYVGKLPEAKHGPRAAHTLISIQE